MLRAKIDLRQPIFLLKFTEDRRTVTVSSKGQHPVPKVPDLQPKHHQ
jgi:hypothetical protein